MWILLLVSIMLTVLSYLVVKRLDNPSFLFCLIWSIVFFVILFGPFDISVDGKTEAILWVMVCMFPLGCACQNIRLKKKYRRQPFFGTRTMLFNKSHGETVYCLKEGFFLLLCGITIFIMFTDEIEIIKNLFSGVSFLDIIKNNGSIQTVEISGMRAIIYIFIAYPITYAVSPICAVQIFNRGEKKLLYFLINITIIFLSVAHHGGRHIIIVFIISYVFALYIYNKKIFIPKKFKIIITIIIIAAIVITLKVSSSRGIENLWESLIAYFACGIPVMQNLLNSSIFSEFTWGFSSLNGLMYPLFAVTRSLGFHDPLIYTYVQNLRLFVQDTWIPVTGYSRNVNAFMPAGAYLYLDGGYIVEIVGMFVYGYFSSKIFHEVKTTKNDKATTLYLLILVGIVLSFIRLYFSSYQYFIGLFYCVFLYKKGIRKAN